MLLHRKQSQYEEARVKINESGSNLRRFIPAVCAVAMCLAVLAAQAQVPTINTVPNSSHPAVPAGMKMTCTPNPNTGAMSPTCPVIQYGSWTTWAYSYDDNRVSFGIVTYDSTGQVVASKEMPGARYVYQITSDAAAKTVSIWGQSNAKVTVPWSQIGPGPAPPGPAAYKWVAGTAPPAGTVTAPDSPNAAVCRGQAIKGQTMVGYWDVKKCISSFAGNQTPTDGPYQFLTVVSGSQQWATGTGKAFPAEIGTVPSNTINAGTVDNLPEVICSQAGHIGWVYKNRCQVGWDPLTKAQNATVLVGTAQ